MSRLRVGVVGAGIGATYVRCLRRAGGFDVVALVAGSERTARTAAEALGIPASYASLERMLAQCALDVVVVAAPNDLHHPMTLAALESGAHVFCDKPLALDAAQAHELWSAAERRGLRHAIPFWWRELPAVEQAADLVASGSIGEPFFAIVRYLNHGWGDPHGPMRWQFQRERAGHGALSNIGSHGLAALRRVAGDLTRVCAHSALSVHERRWPDGAAGEPDVEDTVTAIGELANGAPVSFVASSVAHTERSVFDLSVHCAAGSVSVSATSEDGHVDVRLSTMRAGDAGPAVASASNGTAAHETAYVKIAADLREAIVTGRPARPGFEDGVRVQETMDAMRASWEGGGWVAVERAAAPTPGLTATPDRSTG
jgi:predicted dehydrogenase